MARKTKKQQTAQAQVEARLTSDGPVRLDAEAVTSGRSGGALAATKKRVAGIHPSLEGSTEALDNAGLRQGTVTTASGLQVQIARPTSETRGGGAYRAQAPDFGNPAAPPMQEGISQRFETRIGREHGAARAAELTAEADALASAPNPLRSDGHVDALVALHAPSMGGNQLSQGGAISRLAKSDAPAAPGSNTGLSGREAALHALGYNDEVQSQLYKAAHAHVTSRQGQGTSPALTSAEIASRAYGMVNEHLDEALHGTKRVGTSQTEHSVISDLASGEGGFAVMRNSPAEGAGQAPSRAPARRGPGMTRSRTPIQQAQRQAVRALVRQKGGWAALQSADDHTTAAANDLKVLTLQQKARSARGISAEERSTMSAGSEPEQAARRHAQPVFSTGEHPLFGPLPEGAPPPTTARPGVGVPSEAGAEILPPRARPGAVSPVPTDLPTEPVRLGRSREERGVQRIGGQNVRIHPGYASEIADYEASRVPAPVRTAKPTGAPVETEKSSSAAAAVPASNVSVPQTKVEPKKGHPTFAEERIAQRAKLQAEIDAENANK